MKTVTSETTHVTVTTTSADPKKIVTFEKLEQGSVTKTQVATESHPNGPGNWPVVTTTTTTTVTDMGDGSEPVISVFITIVTNDGTA